MKRLVLVIAVLTVSLLLLGQVELVFWTAPNPLQEEFWKETVDQWHQENPDIRIKWSTIPAAASSEEAILIAIASNQAPDICTNIMSGFAAQLIGAGQLVPLETFPDFWDLVDTREMREIIEGWKFDGSYYVFPIYSNPMMMWWRKDLLESVGFDRAPRTYSEVYEFSKAYSHGLERFGMQVIMGRNWWDRWFDFITYYYAASGGKPYLDVERGRATFDDEYGLEVAKFIDTMFREKWTAADLGANPFYMGVIGGTIMGPWEINWAKTQFPDIYNNIIVAPPPVPDSYPEDAPINTFADTKGLVMFAHSPHKEEAWEFIKWVYSNIENDKRWVEITNMPPARGDLGTHAIFSSFMAEDPVFAEYAKYIPYAIPPALTEQYVDVQDMMTQYLVEPLMYGRATPENALSNAATRIRRILW
ncbi:MAG TPA: sugar ABC transporter substrate-binding protein [Kosmotogaceae bacterium]|nr:MAG: ABC-type sugar transport system, periplasmic component [Thermotogales bacterium 46_20]HAA84865.1 sugar ABC transporter substrate-binding protein [Kosmotogaceae bacterium]